MLRIVLLVTMLVASVAHAMEPVKVEPTRFAKASLTVVASGEEHHLDPAALEALGTYALTTITPWREDAAAFVGIRLKDLLAHHGLEDEASIRVTAENAYAITIPREVWTENGALVATRVDGRAHSRRARGPIQFVFDMSRDPRLGAPEFHQNWVWMAARIEVAD